MRRGDLASPPLPEEIEGANLFDPVTSPTGTWELADPSRGHQVTYNGKPLYLFEGDAYIQGIMGTQGIYGAGALTAWGVFNTIPPLT
jgi:hypothetical protein